MLVNRFFKHCHSLLNSISEDEAANIEQAARAVAKSVEKGGNFAIHDRGHLIGGELLSRAGGPCFVRRLDINVPDPSLTHPHTGIREKSRRRLAGKEREECARAFEKKYIEYAFDINGLGQGDVLMLNSNSGFGYTAVAVAQTAKEKGLYLIVITSKESSEITVPEHKGSKIIDFADVVLDNHAPYGDAVFQVDGLDEKLWPASGFGAGFIAWPIVLRSVELLLEAGIRPTVFESVNVPGGKEKIDEATKRYEELGY